MTIEQTLQQLKENPPIEEALQMMIERVEFLVKEQKELDFLKDKMSKVEKQKQFNSLMNKIIKN